MERIVTFDKHGRLYILEDIRKLMQFKTLVLRLQGGSMVIEPIDDDPIEALGKLGKKKLKRKSIEELKYGARMHLEKEALRSYRCRDLGCE